MLQSFNICPSSTSESYITNQAIDNFHIVMETVQEHIVIFSKSMHTEKLNVSILFKWSEVAFAYTVPDMSIRILDGFDMSKMI